MIKFNHIVSFDSESRRIEIQRVFEDGRLQHMTGVDVPEIDIDTERDRFTEFCKLLGESLIVDSPDGRKIFDI